MKKLILAAGLILALATGGLATPCAMGSLTSYIDLGSTGCTVGDSLFSEFFTLALPTGATGVSTDDILVNPLTGLSIFGLEFQVNFSAGPGELVEALIAYQVTNTAFSAALLSMAGSAVDADGAVTAVEDLCLGGILFFPGACFGGIAANPLIVFDIGLDSETSAQLSFAPSGLIGVVLDIGVDGGLGGSGSLASATTQFETQSLAVPEPPSAWLALAGICGLGLLRSRLFKI